MTADGKIEMAFKVPGYEHLDAWVSLEDSLALIQDRLLYGEAFIKRIEGLPEGSLVTHHRIPPTSVRAA